MGSIDRQLERLRLSPAALAELRQAFSSAIAAGLARDGEQIKALRTYLRPPGSMPAPDQPVAVIDVGGTNCRAAVLVSTGRGFRIAAGPVSRALPVRADPPVRAEAFFELQAELLAQLVQQPGVPLGYCFSYPTRIEPSRDARLIRWTKGIEVPGVVGQLVGAQLAAALEARGLCPSGVVVLNDTVACLLGAALQPQGLSHQAIGLITGTGTNMAGFFDAARAPKLAGSMALNLESGNFCPPPDVLTPADDAIDRAENPGAQRFEKAVSGHYLPYLFAEMLSASGAAGQAAVDPAAGCAPLVSLMNDTRTPAPARELARALFDRSADMVAVGLAALLEHYGAGCVSIVAEGSLFWRTPGYSDRVARTLSCLAGQERFALRGREHVNLVGAACAAIQSGR